MIQKKEPWYRNLFTIVAKTFSDKKQTAQMYRLYHKVCITARLLFCRMKASMTVEAAVVLPLFLFFFWGLAGILEMVQLHARMETALYETSEKIAIYAGESNPEQNTLVASVISSAYAREKMMDFLEIRDWKELSVSPKGCVIWCRKADKDCARLSVDYGVTGREPLFLGLSRLISQEMWFHLWSGYDLADAEEVKLVYVAEHGEVYHEKRDCTYIKIVVKAVPWTELSKERNQSGGKYSACKICAKGERPAEVYLTAEGNRYHFRRTCSGLKRKIMPVRWEEAKQNVRACSKCVETLV